MHVTRLLLWYVLAALIVIVLGGLAGWYFFLHIPQATNTAADAARGLGASTPTFTGTGGSTQQNISVVVGGGAFTPAAVSSSPLWQVDKTPVAGMDFVHSATTTALQYVERANGYVFVINPASRASERLTETLMPKIYEALIGSGGHVIERSIDDSGAVTTFMGTIATIASTSSASTTQNVLKGVYIGKDIRSIVINPADQSIFYLAPNGTGSVDGITAQWNGSKTKKLFSSTITHWTPLRLPDGRLIITESPADDLHGYSYNVASDGTMNLLVGNVAGLTILPHPSSKAFLYGSSAGGRLALFVQDVGSSAPVALTLQTVADKCVWLVSKSAVAYCAVPATPPSGAFLNAWYRGAIHTSDEWWRIDVSTGSTTMIYSPKVSNNVSVDVEHPVIDATGNYIAFINAADQSLWMLKIPQ